MEGKDQDDGGSKAKATEPPHLAVRSAEDSSRVNDFVVCTGSNETEQTQHSSSCNSSSLATGSFEYPRSRDDGTTSQRGNKPRRASISALPPYRPPRPPRLSSSLMARSRRASTSSRSTPQRGLRRESHGRTALAEACSFLTPQFRGRRTSLVEWELKRTLCSEAFSVTSTSSKDGVPLVEQIMGEPAPELIEGSCSTLHSSWNQEGQGSSPLGNSYSTKDTITTGDTDAKLSTQRAIEALPAELVSSRRYLAEAFPVASNNPVVAEPMISIPCSSHFEGPSTAMEPPIADAIPWKRKYAEELDMMRHKEELEMIRHKRRWCAIVIVALLAFASVTITVPSILLYDRDKSGGSGSSTVFNSEPGYDEGSAHGGDQLDQGDQQGSVLDLLATNHPPSLSPASSYSENAVNQDPSTLPTAIFAHTSAPRVPDNATGQLNATSSITLPTMAPSLVVTADSPLAHPSLRPSLDPTRPESSQPAGRSSRNPTTAPAQVVAPPNSAIGQPNLPSQVPVQAVEGTSSSYDSFPPSQEPSSHSAMEPSGTAPKRGSNEHPATSFDFPSTVPLPSDNPTQPSQPSSVPSQPPSEATTSPTRMPSSSKPSSSPSQLPTRPATGHPTTAQPTEHPTTMQPTTHPKTGPPTLHPTTGQPTQPPTTVQPTHHPTTGQPTQTPTTGQPTQTPTTTRPTNHPTTTQPTAYPTTGQPTAYPTTRQPTASPTTGQPTPCPTTRYPTASPTTRQPTGSPTKCPTTAPPTNPPTSAPTTAVPSKHPTQAPSHKPSPRPTDQPSLKPSSSPSISSIPTISPSDAPSSLPSPSPTASIILPNLAASTVQAILLDTTSPQFKANKWLALDPNLNFLEDWRRRQRFALATFCYALNGETWNQNSTWLTYDNHECYWDVHGGIPLDNCLDGHYRSLDVSFASQFQGSMPHEINMLTGLESISLKGNQYNAPLQSLIPSVLLQMPNLQSMDLEDNFITGTIPSHLLQMTGLRRLHLGDNFLSQTIPSEIGMLSALEALDLHSNSFSGVLPRELLVMAKIRSMNLQDNLLLGTLPLFIGLMTSVEYMNLASNGFTGSLPVELAVLTNLKEVSLHRNLFTGSIPTLLDSLTHLEVLNLSENQLTGRIPPSLLVSSTSLRMLDVSSNPQIAGQIPPELSMLTLLEHLALDDTLLTGQIPPALCTVPTLNQIQVSCSLMTCDCLSCMCAN